MTQDLINLWVIVEWICEWLIETYWLQILIGIVVFSALFVRLEER